ncbi:hypothetical protein NDU88_000231 [Pleurodeles waltl]|uniref:Uncharacterized protein n=1 Tax=Pleurodeles waltl TaxID=8319 RepID=A0AAV7VU24_PLEWA|nr:hypothetical protein NDU88_000231 [Pleurodeles waltl]
MGSRTRSISFHSTSNFWGLHAVSQVLPSLTGSPGRSLTCPLVAKPSALLSPDAVDSPGVTGSPLLRPSPNLCFRAAAPSVAEHKRREFPSLFR